MYAITLDSIRVFPSTAISKLPSMFSPSSTPKVCVVDLITSWSKSNTQAPLIGGAFLICKKMKFVVDMLVG